jgi:hypothetical protein
MYMIKIVWVSRVEQREMSVEGRQETGRYFCSCWLQEEGGLGQRLTCCGGKYKGAWVHSSAAGDSSVADPHHFDVDPDPACHFDADPDPSFKKAQNLEIVRKYSTVGIYSIHLQIDPDPADHFDAAPDPDPASNFDADPNPASHFDIYVSVCLFKRLVRVCVQFLQKKLHNPAEAGAIYSAGREREGRDQVSDSK